MHNRFGEEIEPEKEKVVEKHPQSGLFVNIVYVFAVILGAFLVSECIGTIISWIIKLDSIQETKDLSRNFYILYPIYATVMLAIDFGCLYLLSYTLGFRLTYRYKQTVNPKDHFLQSIIAMAVFEVLIVYFEFYNVLPSYFYGGFLAAVFHIFNVQDIYDTILGGLVQIDNLILFFWWIQIIIELIICFASYKIIKHGRKRGEQAALAAREKQLNELNEQSSNQV